MKTKALLNATLSLVLLSLPCLAQPGAAQPASANGGVATNWKQIAIPALPPFHPKAPHKVVLPNGLTVFLTENHELPLISGVAMVRGGEYSEPEEKAGMTEIYGMAWRTGGTEAKTGDQLDDFLEARAAKVETSGGGAYTTLSFNCLKADFDDVFAVFNGLLRQPAFREDKLTLAKKQMDISIARRNDESGDIADMQMELLARGKHSAYARVPEYASVAAVTREDLLAWHKRYAVPNNVILGITGDFDAKQMEAALRKVFADWPKGEAAAAPKVTDNPAKPGIYLVDKSDVNQSEIRMVATGIDRRNPDYFAVAVMNEIFGGGFSSRLFSNLRTKQGLAYSVYGQVGSAWDHNGLTVLSIGTKSESTVDAIKGLWEQVDALKQDAPSEIELKRAKDAILNSFVFNFDTPAKVLREQQTYAFYGYPSDYLEQYRTGVEKVTAADVLRVANKYLHKEELKVLVVGNAAEFQKQLSALGPVETLDITIPTPGAPAAPHGAAKPAGETAGSNPEGLTLLAKTLDAFGGKDAIQQVKLLRMSFKMEMEGAEMPLLQVVAYPDRQAQLMKTPQGELRQVVTPTAAFIVVGDQTRDLPASMRKSEVDGLKRDFLGILQHAGSPDYTFRAAGKETVNGRETSIVEVVAGGAPVRWWIAANGELAQVEYTESGPKGMAKLTMRYEAYKSFGTLRLPTSYVLHSDEGDTVMHLEEVEVNPTIDMSIFEKPQPKP